MDGLQLKYFVLKPKGSDAYAQASRAAMYRYADEIMEVNRDLSLDLTQWAHTEEEEASKDNS